MHGDQRVATVRSGDISPERQAFAKQSRNGPAAYDAEGRVGNPGVLRSIPDDVELVSLGAGPVRLRGELLHFGSVFSTEGVAKHQRKLRLDVTAIAAKAGCRSMVGRRDRGNQVAQRARRIDRVGR